MHRWIFVWISFAVMPLEAAYVLPAAPPAAVVIDWDGIDEFDHDSEQHFTSLGDVLDVRMKVLCNDTRGYRIYFSSNTADTRKQANLMNGAHAIKYRCVVNGSGVRNADIRRMRLNLRDPTSYSVKVRFNQPGHVLPLDGNTQANEIQFQIQLDPFWGVLYPTGVYRDVITATAVLN